MRTILLADDTKTTLAVEKAFLEARHLRVVATESAAEVLELAGVTQPDLIVLDYEMPGMNGDEVCRRLRQRKETREIPVLVVSGHEEDGVRRACLDAGASGFLRKREGREALLDHVAELLGLRHRRHARAACRIAVSVTCTGETLDGVIHNLSSSGVYLTLGRALTAGKPMRLRFKIPDTGFEIQAIAEVVRAQTLRPSLYAYGVQLLEGDEATLTALAEFVQRASLLQDPSPIPSA